MSGLAVEIIHRENRMNSNEVIICRASRHILEQKRILDDASRRWLIQTDSPTKAMIKRELFEYERAKRIIVPSKICKDSFIRQGVPADKVSVVHFPFQLSEFKSNFRKDSNLRVITFVGQVNLRKGICVLIEALNKLEINQIEVRIVGSIHPSLRKFLSQNRVEHLRVSPEKVRDILESTDLFVMPSLEEGWPMAMMEAISMGCIPLVSDAICTVDELPVPNQNFIFQSENSTDLAIKIEYIVNNLKLLSDEITYKYDRVIKTRGWSEFVDDILEELQN
jgi:glycosyltransferase involved in cell wall biosynthesis